MKDYVRTSVDQKFGAPHQIRVWDKLPLKPHAASATVNDAPEIEGDPQVSIEVTEKSSEVVTVAADDLYRPVADLVYSLSGGADAKLFKIDRASGQLAFVSAPSFADPQDADKNNTYEVVVQVSDGSLTDTQAISAKVLKEGDPKSEPKTAAASADPQDEASQTLSVIIDSSNLELKPGQEVAWVSGTPQPSGTAVLLDKYTQDNHLLSLTTAVSAKAGDKIVIGPGEVLTHGRMLYAEHCQHCHGTGGDGKGPTAQYLNPRPRDYRKGIFKFTSTKENLRAHRSDLGRIIEEGIPGTYMPSFKLLKPAESTAIIEYVLFLAMRGETEYQLHRLLESDYSEAAIATRVEGEESRDKILAEFVTRVKEGEIDEEATARTDKMISDWTTAQAAESAIVPKEKRYPSDEASIARGRELYLSNNLNCVACHGESGLGDGIQTYSITVDGETQKPNLEPGLYDTWGNKLKPRNLRLGMFRGGRRPIDIYARIEAGIKGTPMPAFGAKLTEQQKWDIVNYVLYLPHEPRTPGTGIAPAPTTPAPKTTASK
jgi:mono/diheme cytochrome c family protein